MHRQRKLSLLRCRATQVRYAATAAKQKTVTWQETDSPATARTDWARSTDPGSSTSETFTNPANIRWNTRNLASSPRPSSENTSRNLNPLPGLLKALPRDYSASTPSPSQSTRTSTGPGRWTPRLSMDPPSAGLNKWSPREFKPAASAELVVQRMVPKTSRSSQTGGLHRSERDMNFYPKNSAAHLHRWRWPQDQRRPDGLDLQKSQGGRASDSLRSRISSSHNQGLGTVRTGFSPSDPSVDRLGPDDVWSRKTPRIDRTGHKDRGSLIFRSQDDDAKVHTKTKASSYRLNADAVKARKDKRFREKKVVVDVFIPSTVSVGTLARLLNVRLDRLQRKMAQAGMEKEASYDHVLTSDYAALLAEEFGRNPVVNDEAAFDIHPSPPHSDPSANPSRPPIVTIMGHVDHGKTTLLDTLRSSSIAKGEAGGITQHIGAFSVPVPEVSSSASGPQTITFLDTPGHAAFSAMRARGASVTDIVVLVVAADDGVMPQTREVIELVRKDEGKVGLVVAINKVDKPGVDVDGVKRALLSENIHLESFGGDIPSVEVSGLTGHGLNDFVETLSAMAELQDLRAEREGSVHGHVLESKFWKGLGPVATVLVLRGCLTVGSHILSGTSHAKVRVMNDSSGNVIKAAYPGMAVTVSGWKSLPNAGDEVLQGSEADVKKAVTNRIRKAEMESSLVDVEAINTQRRREREKREETGQEALEEAPQGPKELRLVIKGDVSGSVEAVAGAVEGIGNKQAVVKVVSTGVGDVSESDVMMAKVTEGMIVAFSVATPRSVEVIAGQNSVPICSSSIIYRLMDDIKQRVIALLPVIKETKVVGEATVLQLFDIHLKAKQVKKVAGCRVINGILEKAKSARVIRNGNPIHQGMFDTLRHLKKDMTEVRKGLECGLSFADFDDLQEGDLIQVYQEIEKPGVL